MSTRRTIVVGGALSLMFAASCRCCLADSPLTPHTYGCCIDDRDLEAVYPQGTETRAYMTGNEPMIPRSGDRDFDYALAQTLGMLSDTFGVVPGFAYYDDESGRTANAYATQVNRLSHGNGTVLMGINLLQKLRAGEEHPAVAVAGVCSHEFGHILQFNKGLIGTVDAGQPTVKRSELQADYFAGLRKKRRPDYPASVVAATQYRFGDFSTERGHHGTPEERGAAVVRGFEAAFRENKNLNDAIQESTNYVLRL